MAASEAQLAEIIGDIYAAAADSEQWVSVLEGISECMGADGYGLYQVDLATSTVNQMVSNYLTESAVARYNSEFAAYDIWLERTLHYPVGQMVGSQQLTTRRELLDSRFYREYLWELGVDHCAGGFVSRRDDQVVCLAMPRQARTGDYSGDDIAWLNRLAPHLDRACTIQGQMQSNRMLADSALEALDHLAMAMLLLDSNGRIVAGNTLAEKLFVNGLLRRNGEHRLMLCGENNQRIYSRLLRSATKAATLSNPLPGGAFSLVDPVTGRHALEVMVWPFAAGGHLGDRLSSQASVVVFARPRERGATPPVQILQQLYGLSTMETQICCGLLEGLTILEIAESQGVPEPAVRYHCRHILHKAGVRHEQDLMRTVVSGIASVAGFKH